MINNNSTSKITTAGSIDEPGFIHSFDRQGFTPSKSGGELLANSNDAYATTAIFEVNYPANLIKLIDDGIGMTEEGLKNMCNIFKQNHSEHKSMGVSGMGGSAATLQLSKNNSFSKPRHITYFTKKINDAYLRTDVPWDTIFKEEKFIGKVLIREMYEKEIEEFNIDRNKHNLYNKGTTIVFPYSEDFYNLLNEQFKTKKDAIKDSWSVIFGKINMIIKYDKNDGLVPTILRKYDYFEGFDNEFYRDKFCTDIYYFTNNKKKNDNDSNNKKKNNENNDDNKLRFVCRDPNNTGKFWEITGNKRFNKNITEIDMDSVSEMINDDHKITFTSAMRIDDNIFNISNPTEIKANYEINKYDNDFMNDTDNNKNFCAEIIVYRNNQKITSYIPEEHKVSSARGNGESMIKILYIRNSLEYNVCSTQNNTIDIIHGVQQNKNQNQNEFPTNYSRLVQRLIDWRFGKIKKYFEDVNVNYNKNNKIKEVVISNKNNKKIQTIFEIEPIVEETVSIDAEETEPIVEENNTIIVEETDSIDAEETVSIDAEETDSIDEEETDSIDEENEPIVEENNTIDEEETDTIDEEENESIIEGNNEPIVEENNTIDEEDNESIVEETVSIDVGETKSIVEETVSIDVGETESIVEENNTIDVGEIDDSRKWLITASQYIMELAADPNYSQKNGKEIYEKIISLLNN